jgi:glycosyltransferase involved in cell wall biosynthesis
VVESVANSSDNEKDAFLRNACVLFWLIDRPGPFVLVMIEATAYRAPVIAYRRGAIPELIEDGITGFILDGLGGARRAAEHIPTLTPTHHRRLFQPRFHVPCMAEDYLTVYQRPIDRKLTLTYAE